MIDHVVDLHFLLLNSDFFSLSFFFLGQDFAAVHVQICVLQLGVQSLFDMLVNVNYANFHVRTYSGFVPM